MGGSLPDCASNEVEEFTKRQRSLVIEATSSQEISKDVEEEVEKRDLTQPFFWSANQALSPIAPFEVPSSQEFSKGVEEEGLTSTQALVVDSLDSENSAYQEMPEEVKQRDFIQYSPLEASQSLSSVASFEEGTAAAETRVAESDATILIEHEPEVLTSNQDDCSPISEVLSSQAFLRGLEEDDGMTSTQAVDADCASAPEYPIKIVEREDDMDDADFLKDMGLDSLEVTLANLSNEDLETTFMYISNNEHLDTTDDTVESRIFSEVTLNKGGQVGLIARDDMEALLGETLGDGGREEGLTLDEVFEDNVAISKMNLQSEGRLAFDEQHLEDDIALEDEVALEAEVDLEDHVGMEDDMEDTLAELCSEDMNALEQILFRESIFRETCKEVQQEVLKASMEESQSFKNSEEIWRKSSSSKRKSEHVFDFDLEEAKIEPVHKMDPYTSIRHDKRQRKENYDCPIKSREEAKNMRPGQKYEEREKLAKRKTSIAVPPLAPKGGPGIDQESYPEITFQAVPSVTVNGEEEDPDITFNFKGDMEIIFEETHGATFKVDPEITFNFRSPQTLVDRANQEENEFSTGRNGKLNCKRRYTDEEDAAILTYLDRMIKRPKRLKRVETEDVFKRMEVDKVLEGRSWKSLKQRWNSVLRWRDGQKERGRADEGNGGRQNSAAKKDTGLGVRTRGQRKWRGK